MKIKNVTICALFLLASNISSSHADQITNGISSAGNRVGSSSNYSLSTIPAAASNIINFDSVGAPPLFLETVALRFVGDVSFNGSSLKPLNGGAIVNEGGNFGVTGYSAPNFLAFNCGAVMSDGGIPQLPEVIRFPEEVTGVSLKIGTGILSGKRVTLSGIGSLGIEDRTVLLSSALKTVRFTKPLTHISMRGLSGACILVVDDITWK